VNFAIAYFTKAGTFIWAPVNLATFWSSVGNTGQGMADPKVIFDSGSGRFYVIMQENTAASQSFLNVAVSKSSDPATSGASDWYFYRFNMTETVNGVNYGGDYPGLGVDAQAIYVTYNMYPSCGGCSGGIGSSFFNSQIIVLNKAALNKGTGIFASLFPGGFTLRPATVIGSYSPGNVAYFVEIGDSDTVTISALSDPLGARTFSDVEVSVADFGGSIDCGSGSTASTTCAPQAGTSQTVDTNDKRAQNALWIGGGLWVCHTAGGSDGPSKVYVHILATQGYPADTPKWIETSTFSDPSGGWTYQPAIGANDSGQVCLVYCQSSSSTFPTIMYTARNQDDVLSWDPLAVVKASTSFDNAGRWGDYGSVSGDPADGSIWITHEWIRSAAGGFNDAGAWCARVVVPPIIIYVDRDYFGQISDGSPGRPFRTIAEAYAVAPKRSIIRIAGGNYPETLTFNTTVRLERWTGIVSIGRP